MKSFREVIDEWEPCEMCKDRKSPCLKDNCAEKHGGNMECSMVCLEWMNWVKMKKNIRFYNFCPECGRPLNEKARSEIEKRLEDAK